jgi:hypothetical protein
MRWIAIVAGGAVLFCALLAASAAAQDWTIAFDVPTGAEFRTNIDNTPTDFKVEDVEGFILSVTTPYHVGFALEGYSMTIFPGENKTVGYEAQFANVFVEIPVGGVSWLVFSPGLGWGKGKLVKRDSNTDVSNFEALNLWQFYAVLAGRLPWGLQARLGYHEARGMLINRDRSQTPVKADESSVQTNLTTVGIGYTF